MAIVTRNQPQGAVRIDRSNPLTKGLQFSYVPFNRSLIGFATNNNPNQVKFNGGASSIGKNGIGANSGGGANNLGSINSGLIGPNYTLFAFVDGTPSIDGSVLDDDNAAASRVFQFRFAGGAFTFFTFNTSNAFFGLGTSPPAPTASMLSQGFGVAGGVGGNTLFAWQSGTRYTGSITGTPNSPNGDILVGNYKGASNQAFANANVYLVAGWDRVLTDAELASLNANPWQLFQAANQPIFLAASAPTGSATGTASGTSTAQATGQAVISATGTSAGTSTATGAGSSTAAGTATSAGSSTATATGAASVAASGSATGSSTATATGAATSATTASASGTSTAAATSLASGNVGTAAGTSSASGAGVALFSAAGSSTGTSAAQAAAQAIAKAQASAAASSSASATTAYLLSIIGMSSGSSAATGFSAAFSGSVLVPNAFRTYIGQSRSRTQTGSSRIRSIIGS